jgi:hypothetical protein
MLGALEELFGTLEFEENGGSDVRALILGTSLVVGSGFAVERVDLDALDGIA